VIYVLLRLTRFLFDPRDSGRRTIPCNDAVASHYRRLIRMVLVWTLILLPGLEVLSYLGVVPGLHSLFWELFKTGALLWAVVFLAPKRLVIGLGGLPRDHWVYALLSTLYPLLFSAMVALWILQVIGYGSLAEFVGVKLWYSLIAAAVMGLIVEYLCDRWAGDVRASPPHGEGRPVVPGRRPEMDGDRLLYSLFRFIGIAVTLALLLRLWFGEEFLGYLGWKPTLLLGVVVAAALVIDRLVRTALRVLLVSGRLPEKTVGIIRRWTRGVLVVAVILVLVALAGYPIKTIWAPLSALFAMVAIGFVAVWSLLSNVLATIIILIWRPFNVGDRVEIQPDGINGDVVDINFMFTLLRSDDGARIAVPNSLFVQRCLKREATKTAPTRSLAQQLESETPADE
jgi:small-conductance mechanosensitive channel